MTAMPNLHATIRRHLLWPLLLVAALLAACSDPEIDVDGVVEVMEAHLPGPRSVATGGNHTCTVLDGRVRCWGRNNFGQLGVTGTVIEPLVDVPGITDAVAVTAGLYHSCALLASGQVKCWGYNIYGQLGNGTTTNTTSPTFVSNLTNATKISAGRYHTCAIAGGMAKCWGYNAYGQLGDGTTTNRLTPVSPVYLWYHWYALSATEISAGGWHTCAVGRRVFPNEDRVYCWGRNNYGQLGDGTTQQSAVVGGPVGLPTGPNKVGAGDYHSCASLTSTEARCWGRNNRGQLSNGNTTNSTTPVTVLMFSWFSSGPAVTATDIDAVSAGGEHTCMVLYGYGVCAGRGAEGQIGYGATDSVALLPPVFTNTHDVATGLRHSCSWASNGRLRCTGWNNYGQLGDGTTTNKTSATLVFVDADNDGIHDSVDNCPGVYNPDQLDSDGDGLGDACDPCPFDPTNDEDGDGVCEDVDNCPGVYNPDQLDTDGDGLGDACDPCPFDPTNDEDGDGVCEDVDNCPGTYNPDQTDTVGDGVGDACRCFDVVCDAPGPCHQAGACEPPTGECHYPVAPECTVPPTWPPGSSLAVTALATTSLTLEWTAATHAVEVAAYDIYQDGGLVGSVPGQQHQFGVEGLVSGTGYLFQVQARDPMFNASSDGPSVIATTPVPPPPVENRPVTTLGDLAEFLYTGPDAPQTGVDPDEIDLERVAIARGRVTDGAGTALADVVITVKDRPGHGQTMTDEAGEFAMAINGGGHLVLSYEKAGYLPAHRNVHVPWNEVAWASDVALVRYVDSPATVVSFDNEPSFQIARGHVEEDADGARQGTVLIPPYTSAMLIGADGSSTPANELTIRVTEYTVGENGLAAMPAELPPGVAYTWAAEFGADEAIAAGATRIEFDQPVFIYVENFIGFPVGGDVPMGYYDRERAAWVASDNGRVIAIVGLEEIMPGIFAAQVDLDGDGLADDASALAGIGLTTAERVELAATYTVGETLWRVPVTHFTPWDCNWGIWPPSDAVWPDIDPDELMELLLSGGCNRSGSIINCENQSLGEQIPIAGTSIALAYESGRAKGRTTSRTVTIPLSGASVAASCQEILLDVRVAGRRFEQSFPCTPDLSTSFTWDGYDAWGRYLQGAQPGEVRIGYRYGGVSYGAVARFGGTANFGLITGDRAARTLVLWQRLRVEIGAVTQTPATSIGGWEIDIRHKVDPAAQMLYSGDGTTRSYSSANIQTFHNSAPLDRGMSVGADGAVYYHEGERVHRRDRAGQVSHVAGVGPRSGCFALQGDGGPATDAAIGRIVGSATGRNGELYLTNSKRLRVIHPDGIIDTIAADPSCREEAPVGPEVLDLPTDGAGQVAVTSDGTIYLRSNSALVYRIATDRTMEEVPVPCSLMFSFPGDPGTVQPLGSIAVGPDDSLYFGCRHRIWRRSPAGELSPIAGTDTEQGSATEGEAALETRITSVPFLTVAPDGTVFFPAGIASGGNPSVVRAVRGGQIHRVAGARIGPFEPPGTSDDPGHPHNVEISPHGLAVHSDGSLLIRERSGVIRRVGGVSAGTVPSGGGELAYLFDSRNLHVATVATHTGAVVYGFDYDDVGRLVQIVDSEENAIAISWNAAGEPTGITGPYGHQTTLTVNADGYLETVTNPVGETVELAYYPGGLLQRYKDARGYEHTYDVSVQSLHRGKLDIGDQRIVMARSASGRKSTARGFASWSPSLLQLSA